MKWDMPEPSLPPSHHSLPFYFLFLKNLTPPHISLFLTEIHLPLSGQSSDEN